MDLTISHLKEKITEKKEFAIFINVIGVNDLNRVELIVNRGSIPKSIMRIPGNNTFFERILPKKFSVTLTLGGAQQPKEYKFDLNTLFINAICDPTTNKKALLALHQIVQSNKTFRVINNPRAVLRLSKENFPKLLEGIEKVTTPKTLKLTPTNKKQLIRSIEKENFTFPIVITEAESFERNHIVKMGSLDQDDILDIFSMDGRSFYVSEFIDYMSKDKLYRKTRIVVVGGKATLQHHIISNNWIINDDSRDVLMKNDKVLQKEEETFLRKIHPDVVEKCKQIAQKLALDYFALDCHITDENEIIVLNITPQMRLTTYSDYTYLNKPTEYITKSFASLIETKYGQAKS